MNFYLAKINNEMKERGRISGLAFAVGKWQMLPEIHNAYSMGKQLFE
jgi:hypothetical protein